METLESLQDGVHSGRLAGCKSLKLSEQLTHFPVEIFQLADSLEFLNLSNNQLSELPPNFSSLKNLRIVFFNNNKFERYPPVLADCPALSMVSFKNNQIHTISEQALSPTIRWLILTNNQIDVLPAAIGRLNRLQKLMLAGNRLKTLPEEMANCQSLELIRLSVNRLSALPTWLLQLPRLSWLAYSGNPFCLREAIFSPKRQNLPTFSSDDLEKGHLLGQGASGLIYEASWSEKAVSKGAAVSTKSMNKSVALKIFKGDITSDGSPLDEMRACIAAGTHPNLVSVLGKYSAENTSGLVFDFISADYSNLGDPPSLESCTRDVYDEDVSFSLSEVLKIGKGIASAAAYLHQHGIMHGDLYAHNILVDQTAHSILGDFGAASFYGDNLKELSIEKLEVRAFGCLLEDLLDRCSVPEVSVSQESGSFLRLRLLQQSCLMRSVDQRPLFCDVCEELTAIDNS